MIHRHWLILILALSFGFTLKGQRIQKNNAFATQNNLLQNNDNIITKDVYLKMGDTTFIMRGNCKNQWAALFTKHMHVPVVIAPNKREPFVTVHGNVLYNFSYRSYIDTPFAQHNLQQHLVQTNIGFLIAAKYPLQMTLSSRSSNSPYFLNRLDANFNFNRRNLMDVIKNKLLTKTDSIVDRQHLYNAERLYGERREKISSLQAWVNNPQRQQELAREKQQILSKTTNQTAVFNSKTLDMNQEELAQFVWPGNPGQKFNYSKSAASVKNIGSKQKAITALAKEEVTHKATELATALKDSVKNKITNVQEAINTDSTVSKNYEEKKELLNNLIREAKEAEKQISAIKKAIQDSVNMLKRAVAAIQSNTELKSFIKNNHIAQDELTKGQRILLSVNNVGIGRNWVDYSELTVKNITLTGFNAELNPGRFYFAFAAGKINYRFRDFIIKNNQNNLPDQSLYMLRAGVGKKEGNNFILSFYNGKKSTLDYSATTDPSPLQRVLGIAAEAKLKLDNNNYIIAEVAKSSFGNITSVRPPSTDDLIKNAFNLKVRSNEAYSIKLFSDYPRTNTKITGFYRSMGQDFQSYNLFPSNINQDAFMIKINQSLWKKIITLEAAVRKNDFASPIAAPSFSSKTVFKSLQATFRKAKYPFVSVGYFPSTQLTINNNRTLLENQYNTLNSVMSYSYRFKKTSMNSSAVFTKFYNSSSDTAFLYFNASTFSFNQSIFLGKLTSQSAASYTNQLDLQLLTLEQSLNYQFNHLTIGAGLKWNKIKNAESLFGASALLGIQVKKLGTIQFNYEKTYLPAYNRQLMPVDIGRMSFYRQF